MNTIKNAKRKKNSMRLNSVELKFYGGMIEDLFGKIKNFQNTNELDTFIELSYLRFLKKLD